MTAAILILKFLGGIAAPVAVLSAGSFFVAQHVSTKVALHAQSPKKQPKLDRPERHVYSNYSIVVAGATLSDADSSISQINTKPGQEDFKCKLSLATNTEDNALFCHISKITITKGWIDIAGIKRTSLADNIQKTDLSAATNYFKVDVDANFYSKIILTDSLLTKTSTMDIVSKDQPLKKIAQLTPIFKFFDGGMDFEKTRYALGKAGPDASAVESGKTYHCPFVVTKYGSPFGTCNFYAFGSTTASLSGAGYSNQTVNNPTKTNTPVVTTLIANKYYLIHNILPITKAKVKNHNTISIQKHENDEFTPAGTFKDVVPVIVLGTSTQSIFILSETPSHSVVVQKTSAITGTKNLIHNQTFKNYQCRLDSAAPVNCNLVPLSLTSGTKTSITPKEIEDTTLTTPLSITSSTTKPTYYKLEVDPTFFTNFSSGAISTKTINVVEVKEGDTQPSVLFTLKPLFSIDDKGAVHFDTSTFIVSGADYAGGKENGTLTAEKTRYCSFSSTDQGGADAKSCSLIDLGTSLQATQAFDGTAIDSAVDKSKTYLVKVETPGINGFNKGAKDENDFFIFEEQDGSGMPPTRQQIAKFPAASVKPVILVDDTSPNKFAFIIG